MITRARPIAHPRRPFSPDTDNRIIGTVNHWPLALAAHLRNM
jgi:hypothetical protein